MFLGILKSLQHQFISGAQVMALICEECGKIYHIDKEKLKKQLKGDFAKTKCRICGHIIQISREELEKDDEIKIKADDDSFFNEFSEENQSFGYESDFEETKNYSSDKEVKACLLYTSPSPRDLSTSRMPSSA
eukprot:TRINITY_DN46563_c0_g1_i1.p1 TRINITY_DN46563_c0_g1~~TRINITY_DN46563_c0_g1_i1.p1  ORF type:complete len:133 (-),score=28.86 TRINITY_DN46563_c0_g1_i1:67-465(-)